MPTSTNYFEFVIDPSTGNQIEVRDKYAREQLVHKTEKTVENSLPAKPTTYDAWLAMERFLYFVPIDGEENQYEAWTLFFIGDPTVPADYTDTDNYEWVQIAVTDTDLTNFSTKGHTHEVIPETEVEDHDYTPQGTVSGSFTGNEGTTASDGSHQHSFTPAGSVSSSFSGTEGTTSNDGSHTHSFTPAGSVSSSFSGSAANTDSVSDHKHSFTPSGTISGSFTGSAGNTGSDGVHNHTLTKTAKKLSTKKLSVAPATSVNFTGSTTNAQRATGALETLSTYDASKAVFNGIDVTDGVLSFVTKKMTTADTVSGLSATIDASKVTYNGNGTATNEDVATGALSDPASGDPTVLADASVDNSTGHTHTFTPSGSVAATFSGTSDETGDAGGHQHSYTPSGTVTSSFSGTSDDTGSAGGHTHTLTPAGSVTSSFSGTEGNTGSAGSHTHAFTPSGGVAASFSGLRANLKHKVDNKKVRTSPDSEDEGSHAYDWYGILFDEDEDDPQKTRVGNMDMHRMLPIQTKLRRCILNDDGTVNYYLDDRDSTKKAGSQEGWVTSDVTFLTKTETDDVRDNTEYLKSVKGHSIVWNQLVKNGNFVSSDYWSGGTAVDNVYTCTKEATGTATTHIAEQGLSPYVNNHKYIFLATVKSNNEYTKISLLPTGTSSDGASVYTLYSEWTNLHYFWTQTGIHNNLHIRGYNQGYPNNDISFSIKNVMCFDLTLMFGEGNEPTTAAQFDAWLAQNVGLKDYYDYDAGSILNNKMAGIKTTSNGQTNTYPYDVTKIYGQLNGEGDLTQVYPNGMLSAGSIKDVLTKDSAVVNVGRADLGTFDWHKNGTSTTGGCYYTLTNPAMNNTATNKNVIIDRKYIADTNAFSMGTPSNNYTCLAGNGKIFIDDVDISDADELKTSLSGRYANFMVTPLTYTNLVYRDNGIDIPLNQLLPNGINVGKGGTIEIVAPQVGGQDIMMAAPTLTIEKYLLQAGATLDGSDGQVMVEIPEHWRKVYTYLDGAKTMVKAMISPYPQETTGWIHVRKGYISAYEANIDANNKLCSTSDIKDLVLSVVNGKVNATCDVSVIGETGAPADWAAYIAGTHSLFPTTSVTMETLRTDARARHSIDGDPDTRWNMLVYEQCLALYWLYVIEYANLNSQATVNVALDYDGFHQGGLGNGVTTVDSTAWGNFNSSNPFVPCGITNCLGNHSGEVILALPSAFGTNIKVSVNSYRGVEMPFGHIWKFADGIKYLGDGTQQAVLRCGTPANYSSDSNSNNYTSIGNNVGSNGYKKKIMIGDDGDINCKAVGGGALKAYCDYNYQAHENGTYYCSLLGGHAYGALAGLACVGSLFGLAYASTSVGSRLCFFEK